MIIKEKIEQVPFVDLKAQYNSMASEINKAMGEVINNTSFILGKEVKLFEEEFAQYCQANFAVGVDSGTSALELALRAYGIGQGDEVITAANTFIATALAISYTGARPVLVDIDPQTYNIDINFLEDAITNKTKAVIPIHLYGQPADMNKINEIASYGRYCIKKILEKPSIENLFSLSQTFTKKTGLADEKVLKAIDVANHFGMASMCMLGNSIFAIGKTNELCKALTSFGKVYVCNIDEYGARVIEK